MRTSATANDTEMSGAPRERGRMTLAARYVVAFGLLVILPVVFVSVIFERQLAVTIAAKVSDQSVEIVTRAAELIDSELRTLTIRSSALVNDAEFLESASRYAGAENQLETLLAVRDLDALIARFFLDSNVLGSVYIVPEDERYFYAYQNTSSSQYLERIPPDRYASALAHPGLMQLVGDLKGVGQQREEYPLVTLAVSPNRDLPAPGVQAIVFSARIKPLVRLLSPGNPLLDEGTVAVVDAAGSVVYSLASGTPLDEALPHLSFDPEESHQEIELDEHNLLATRAPIGQRTWNLVFLQNADLIEQFVRRERLPLYVSVSIIVVGFIAYSFLFFKSTVSPLHALSARMGEVEQGRFDVAVSAEGPREVASLSKSFNRMVRRISELTQETEQKERARANAELEALQHQINPHFVSNTLNSIRLMAHGSGASSIARMTGSLMRIVSDSLRTDEHEVSLGRELENLEHYGFIMKVRFGETFTLQFDVPEEHREYRLLKMLIQPIVENAIVHGVQQSLAHGEIVVTSESGPEAFLVRVIDNGCGMDSFRELGDHDEDPTVAHSNRKIGLRNVHRRIALHYGAPHGLRVESAVGQGTTVTLHLPAEDRPPS